MVRYDLVPARSPKMTVVFNTVDYGANKTIFDHGWNALVISPDEKFIYANSGARTDHGEVQDNGGLYPGARDNNLTSKIFRIPSNAENLLLTDDRAKLIADGYLYAEGIHSTPMTLLLITRVTFLASRILLITITLKTCSG